MKERKRNWQVNRTGSHLQTPRHLPHLPLLALKLVVEVELEAGVLLLQLHRWSLVLHHPDDQTVLTMSLIPIFWSCLMEVGNAKSFILFSFFLAIFFCPFETNILFRNLAGMLQRLYMFVLFLFWRCCASAILSIQPHFFGKFCFVSNDKIKHNCNVNSTRTL